ncbi:hypothetical protein SpCBS45565_g06958 [Spizellomyces sp. 'palustris']|nr:hypothetical protein SpCBS45565_g06958 [Spizellomyces sp. 'palustris']
MAIHNWRPHSPNGSVSIPGTVNIDDTSSLRSASLSVGSGTISPLRGSITALYHWRLGKPRGGGEMDSLEESRSRVLSSVDGELMSPVLSSSSTRIVADAILSNPVLHVPAMLPPVQTTERKLDEMLGLTTLSNPETDRDVSHETDGIARNVSVVALSSPATEIY